MNEKELKSLEVYFETQEELLKRLLKTLTEVQLSHEKLNERVVNLEKVIAKN
jgi:hypothetical protein